MYMKTRENEVEEVSFSVPERWRAARFSRVTQRARFSFFNTAGSRKRGKRRFWPRLERGKRTALEIVPRISIIFVEEEDRPLQLCLIFDGWALRKNFLLSYFSSVLSKSSSEFRRFVGFDEVISKIKVCEKFMLIFRVYSFERLIERLN